MHDNSEKLRILLLKTGRGIQSAGLQAAWLETKTELESTALKIELQFAPIEELLKQFSIVASQIAKGTKACNSRMAKKNAQLSEEEIFKSDMGNTLEVLEGQRLFAIEQAEIVKSANSLTTVHQAVWDEYRQTIQSITQGKRLATLVDLRQAIVGDAMAKLVGVFPLISAIYNTLNTSLRFCLESAKMLLERCLSRQRNWIEFLSLKNI